MTADASVPRSGPAPRRPRPAAIGVLVVLVAAFVVVPARLAHADPARPTIYRSQVTGLQPATDAVTVEVVGGDAFLRITLQPGHSATVYGYRSEPYLRIDDDGTVEANLNSPAYYLNEDRYANAPVPDRADPEAEPDWTVVADGGTYVWHDHRIHWMSRDLPRSVRAGAGVQPVTEVSPWEVPIAVDGTDTTVRGELVWVPTTVPTVPLIVGVLAAAAGWVAARHDSGLTLVLAAAGLAAVVAAVGEATIQPEGPAAGWTNWGPPAIAALLALGATLTDSSRRTRDLLVLSGALIAIWLARHLSTLWLPVLPSVLDPTVARALVAATAGLLAGAVAQRVRTAAAALSTDSHQQPTPTDED